ncbi:MAG: T9SS type A sorting domain-containing protein [Melioribacteraceae bacterium]|nr:T9SS type A sorting domain-containing protein [Melioribacteraceae bacterium]MCF8354060.1 T9SS type A sorting domain-containing protein [Melioribacteraceae bacterium]MCF8393733.1 T9SS type A sorting domain-containing protein [Melioribacteraceae bacterium]MCF8417757.1 T9SS type A sorting domain-containing protein [Melioribacteraceae bacterium]
MSNPIVCRGRIFSSPQSVTLKVYDILGNEVATLVNEKKEAGYFEVKINASDLSSGLYFYKIHTLPGFVSTKKLMLLK